MLSSSWCESQRLTRQPPELPQAQVFCKHMQCALNRRAPDLAADFGSSAAHPHLTVSSLAFCFSWRKCSEGRQGCQASNSEKSNNNVTHTYTFQLWSAVCWAVLWFLRNSGLASCSYPSQPQSPVTQCCGVCSLQWRWAAGALGAGAIATQAERL